MNYSLISGSVYTVPKMSILPVNEKIAITKFVVASSDWVGVGGKTVWNFFECVAFNDTAQHICEKFDKRNHISLMGRWQNYVFSDNNHTKHFTQIFLVEHADYGDVIKFNRAKAGSMDMNPVVSEISDLNESFNKVVEEGFLCLDEEDYCVLASGIYNIEKY